MYQNFAARNHCECSLINNPFRSKCACTEPPAEETSAVPGGRVSAAIDSEGREIGKLTQLPGESTNQAEPMQAASVGLGEGGAVESPMTDAGSCLAAGPSVLGTCPFAGGVPFDPQVIMSSWNGSASNSASAPQDRPGGGAPIDAVGSNSGESIPGPERRADPESYGGGDASKALGAHFIDNMSPDVARQFAQVAVNASALTASEFNTLHKVMDNVYPRQVSNRARKHSETGRVKSARGQRQRGKTEKSGTRTAKRPETGNTSLPLSEENKEHLKIITTAVISDMMKDMQRLVADDPRIKRLSFGTSKRFKEKVIKDYRAELMAKRKSEIALLETALILAKSSVSSEAYATVRHILVKNRVGWALPTTRDVTEARNKIMDCAHEDLKIFETEDGWAASPRATIELELHRMMQMTTLKATFACAEDCTAPSGHN